RRRLRAPGDPLWGQFAPRRRERLQGARPRAAPGRRARPQEPRPRPLHQGRAVRTFPMQRVALIDYGSGNLRSAEKALVKVAAGRAEVAVTCDPDVIARADRIVLPGVGAFAACMSALASRPGVIAAMEEAVRGRGAPFLGICVGMQLLASRGLEFGETPGLDWIEGDVRRLDDGGDPAIKIPHMGWNSLSDVADHPVFG